MKQKIIDIIKGKFVQKFLFSLMALILGFFNLFSFQGVLAASTFNTGASDLPLRVGNATQSSGTLNWGTSLSGVNSGDELKFQVYYHNAGNTAANNAKVTLRLSPSGSSSNFQAESQISATGFNTYTSNASIGLNQAQSINLKNTAKWYHNYDGSKYQIDDVNVTVSGNIATFDLEQVNAGYAPNDGYIIFSAEVEKLNNFNSDTRDYPLRVGITDWATSLSNVNPGDEVKFSVYYHNASDEVAKNGKVVLSLSQKSPLDFVITSKISANNFEDYVSSADIGLSSSATIELKGTAKWFSNYNGSEYVVKDVNVDVVNNEIVFDLDEIGPGYAPNDGYIVFDGIVSKLENDLDLKKEELYGLLLGEIEEIAKKEIFLNLDNGNIVIKMDYGSESENYTDNLSFYLSEFSKELLNGINIQGDFYYKIKICNLEECYCGKEHLL